MIALFSKRFRGGGLALAAALMLLLPGTSRAQVIINEILANNETNAPLAEIPDYFPEYIELYNPSTVDIDLGAEGWTITDNALLTNKYQFPFGTIIGADSLLLLFCDNETNLAGIHVGFSLDAKTGETITLYKRALTGAGYVRVTQTSFGIQLPGLSVGRVPGANGNANFTLNYPTPCGGTIPCLANKAAPHLSTPFTSNQFTLKINEWLATNSAGADEDWLELYNPDPTNIVSLAGLIMWDKDDSLFRAVDHEHNNGGPKPIPDLSYIAPGGFVQLFCSGDVRDDADNLNFGISSGSEGEPAPGGVLDTISLYGPSRLPNALLDRVYSRLRTARNISEGRVPDGSPRIGIFPNPTPGEPNFGPIPELIINEVLSHTDPPLEDCVEFYNPTTNDVDISHWWLSNGRNNPKKYQFPANTKVPANGYFVAYQREFGNSNVLGERAFTFNSSRGDECYIFKADASGELLGFRKGVQFGAAPNATSFGRYVTSDTNAEFVALTDITFGTDVRANSDPSRTNEFHSGRGAPNAPIFLSPVVINEIHFHPPEFDGIGGTNDNSIDEFIEIRNYASTNVPLYYNPPDWQDQNFRTNRWKLRGVVDYDFPTNDLPFIAANGYLLVVNFDPNSNTVATADWLRTNGVAPGTKIYGPYRGKLSNREGNVELYRPDTPNAPPPHPDGGLTPQILVDRVHYEDRPPWPSNAVDGTTIIWSDGGKASVQRRFSYEYGNDPINWFVDRPTPGYFNSRSGLEVPYFLVSPQDFTNLPPRTGVTLSALARGSTNAAFPRITYQWYRNGVPIPAAVGPNHIIPSVGGANIGQYYVVATSQGGPSTSRVATVSVACPFLLSRIGFAFGQPGGNGSVTVTAPEGCPWEVEGIQSWITVTSPTNFDGDGTFSFSVGPYAGTTVRSAILLVAGQPFRIAQSPPDSTRPTVAISAPSSGARVTSPVAIIRGTANDNYDIQRVEVQNGANPYVPAIGTKAWTNVTTLQPGTNWIRVRSIDLTGNISATNTRSIIYVVTSPLNLAIISNGWGTVSGATNLQRLELGRGYTLTATPRPGYVFSNWVGDILTTYTPKLQFLMAPNMSITANFAANRFIPVKGSYYGLFSVIRSEGVPNDIVGHTNSGSFKLTTTDKGTYSASISIGGKKYSATGQFDLDGLATNVILRTGFSPLTIKWILSLSTDPNLQGIVTGEVSAPDWAYTPSLRGDLAWWHATTNRAPVAGKYTLVMPGLPDNDPLYPQGDGYGTVTISTAGVLTFAGVLADGVKVSQSVPLGRYTSWPLYAVLYGARGSVLSWVGVYGEGAGFGSGDLAGTSLFWRRPSGPTPKYYPSGFNLETSLSGFVYHPPVGATNRILNLTNAQIVLSGGNLPVSPSINNITLGLSSKVTNQSPNTLTFAFTLSSGLFSGTYRETGTTRTIPFKGAVLQNPLLNVPEPDPTLNLGSGFFLGTNESGRVSFEMRLPPPPPQ